MKSFLIGKTFDPHKWFLLCFLAPIGGGILRKITPGQPAYMEVLAVLPIFVALIKLNKRNQGIPQWLMTPIFLFMLLQVLYSVPSVLDDWKVGTAAVLIRVVPMFMALIAYESIHQPDDLNRFSSNIVYIPLVLFPIAIFGFLYGNASLPMILQPVQKVMFLERDVRNGLNIPVTVFTTQWVMSWSLLAVLYVLLAELLLNELKMNTKEYYVRLLSCLAALGILYLSYRRGSLVVGVTGVVTYIILSKRKIGLLTLLVVGAVGIIFLGLLKDEVFFFGNMVAKNSELVFAGDELNPATRYSDVFWPWFSFWLKVAPFGNYLGYSGPEARGFGVLGALEQANVVEVGGAQLAAEMGYLGAFLFPSIVFVLSIKLILLSYRNKCFSSVLLLILFQMGIFANYYFKEFLALVNISMGQFLFWANFGLCAALIKNEKR